MFSEKITQMTKILHDRRSRRSRQIPSLYVCCKLRHLWLLLYSPVLTSVSVSQSVTKGVKMQDAKLDIDVDVKTLKQRFGQNFIIYHLSC